MFLCPCPNVMLFLAFLSSLLHNFVPFVVYLLSYFPLLHPSCFMLIPVSCYTHVFQFLWCFLSAFTSCILSYLTSQLFTFLSLSLYLCFFFFCILRTSGVFLLMSFFQFYSVIFSFVPGKGISFLLLYIENFMCLFLLLICSIHFFFFFFCSWKWYKQQYNPQLKYQLAYLYLSSGFLHHFLLWRTWNWSLILEFCPNFSSNFTYHTFFVCLLASM